MTNTTLSIALDHVAYNTGIQFKLTRNLSIIGDSKVHDNKYHSQMLDYTLDHLQGK